MIFKKRFISYKFIDSRGGLRDKIVYTRFLKSTCFDGSSIGYMPTNKSDVILEPDKKSIHFDPIRGMSSVFCFIRLPDGNKFDKDPRTIAFEAQNEDEQTRGALFGVEPEFFILKKMFYKNRKILCPLGIKPSELYKTKQGKWYGSLPPVDCLQEIKMKITQALEKSKFFDIESVHSEVSPGQVEISFKCDKLLRTADKLLLFKYIVINTCKASGYIASFEAKPFAYFNGSGCHIHQSIPLMKLKKNDDILICYANGLIEHYNDLLPLCCCGKTSKNRLIPGFEAPTAENNSYGYFDRTKTIRLPAGGGRIEFRLPDPSINPYLALSKMLEYGYASVKRNIKHGA